ncbi:hypothetical protein ABBQ32_001396 [Trebouxia sp. C0010 RCD-2024]
MHGAVNTLESLTRLRSVNHSAGFTRLQCKRSCSSVRPFRHSTVSQLQAVSSTWDVVTTNTLALSAREIPMLSGVLDKGEQHALLLSTLAGLSTSIGGAIAIVKKPGNDLLSFLLGIAIGVMATLSVLEMWLHNALEHGPIAITAATAAGIALYYIAQPYFPDFDTHQATPHTDSSEKSALVAGQQQGSNQHGHASGSVPVPADAKGDTPQKRAAAARSAELLRLGLLMALTMTLHNFPEGFAVAFSSFTSIGPVMAIAIAVHNIPEGVIVAAPVYAATGSRWKAMGIATASGLSEPFGALMALLSIRPFLTPMRLQYMLAFVGGVMVSITLRLYAYWKTFQCRSQLSMIPFELFTLQTLHE